MEKFDFSGWATRANKRCSDGRIILPDAFKHMNGEYVPIAWNHKHGDPSEILGKAYLEHRDGEGVYCYGIFNDTESGQTAKKLVLHGDITGLSIFANNLKERMSVVSHGDIKEVSLVLATANPGAYIDNVMVHNADGSYTELEDQAFIFSGEGLELHHADDSEPEKEKSSDDETIEDVINGMTDKQKTVLYALVGEAAKSAQGEAEEVKHSDIIEHSEGGEDNMKKNVFDQTETKQTKSLSHADQQAILELAKQSNVGSWKQALNIYLEENGLMHSADGIGVFEDFGVLFPEFELLKKGEPETIYPYDNGWVKTALAKIHKSPFSRIRTRHADARVAELKAKGYQKKGDEKTIMGQIKMVNRTTDPQTIYIKDAMHRDDVIDITEFDVVAYQWAMMRRAMDETIILAAMVGDGRELDDPDKIHEEHVRPIWTDNEEYTIHYDVDFEAAKTELQGANTGANFSDNYIKVEAIIRAALYSREKFKGTGTPDFYCTPHTVNEMLLARDLNGRRIYDSKADLAKALNVDNIYTAEQFEGLTRTTEDGKTKKLLGLFVNLSQYHVGATKGGQLTKFEQFDIDFNQYKYLLETRLSGASVAIKSAIALEEDVTE